MAETRKPTESECIERTIELGERALGYLKYNGTPAIPRNYELWYTYASGANKSLVKAIQGALDDNSRLSLAETERLCEMYLSPSRVSEQIEEVGLQLNAEIKEIMTMLKTASDSNCSFGQSLDGTAEKLNEGLSNPNQLKDVVATLVESTKEMAKNSRELETHLEDSRRQIEELNVSLETIRAESMTDQLTGIANRKRFDQKLALEMGESLENKKPLCLLLADIDHFKKFNDTYGHQTGDQVLRLVAYTMKTNVKGQDLAARYGGEEFAIILPCTDLSGGISIAETIRKAVLNKELVKKTTGESLGRISLSIGAALFRPGESAETLIHRADACLYAAKAAGRNQVKSENDPDINLEINAA